MRLAGKCTAAGQRVHSGVRWATSVHLKLNELNFFMFSPFSLLNSDECRQSFVGLVTANNTASQCIASFKEFSLGSTRLKPGIE